jgi:Chalcone isomerase-like
MIVIKRLSFKYLLASAFLASVFSQGAMAAEVSGVKFDDTAKVAGKELVLNGVGMRNKFVIKVYAAGLYLPEKKTAVPDIMKLDGPRRMTLVMMRDISTDDFGEAFMKGLSNNSDSAEKSRFLNQTMQFGQMFGSLSGVKKGDVLHLDWIPGTGMVCEHNGKQVGETMPDLAFYNAVLRIWIGDKPVDNSLKSALLRAAR